MQIQNGKLVKTKYAVLKDFFLYGKLWKAPLYDGNGKPKRFNMIELNQEDSKWLYHTGHITDDLPRFINGTLVHPLDRRF